MSILTARQLARSYGAQDVFAGVTLDIHHGDKIALVGANGSGKTTLLRLLAGLDEPSAGEIHRAKDLSIAYLPQQADFSSAGTLWEAMEAVFADLLTLSADLRRLEAEMAASADEETIRRYGQALEAFELAGGYQYEQHIEQVLTGLGFAEADFHRPLAQLSGGQRTRGLLARLLLEEPQLLLLDEPTNHLDIAGIEWLEEYLKAWPGAVVVVAHDRAFLDAVVERVWELDRGHLRRYRGNYTAYTVQRAEHLARQRAEYERQQEFIARTEEFIRRNLAGQRTKEAQGRRKRLERLARVARPQTDLVAPRLALGDAARSGDLVLGLYDLAVGYEPARPLFTADEFELRRGERVALVGPNGSGKTTLVRTLLGEIPPLSGRVRVGANVHLGHFAQGHADLDLSLTVLDTILAASDLTIGAARNFLSRYRFFGDDVFKRVGDLSGGEQARVALALLALRGANVLLLDEPTNHLDIPSQEALQSALADFGGTLLLVTHDRYLIRRLATAVWAIDRETGRLRAFEEGYAEYRQWEAERRQSRRASRHRPPTARQLEREARRQRRRAEREAERRAQRQAELEAQIRHLEARQRELETRLALASRRQEVERVRRLGDEYSALEAELDALLLAWTELG